MLLGTLVGLMMGVSMAGAELGKEASKNTLFDIPVQTLEGKSTTLAEHKGKVLLVVNVASKCGFTSQYKELQELHQKYEKRGFTVLGFPSNDFGGQEPGSNDEIKKFCQLNYGVTFPMYAKNPVKGDAKQPVYKHLLANLPEDEKGEVKWNFEKIIVDKEGKVLDRYRSMTSPMSDKITKKIEGLL